MKWFQSWCTAMLVGANVLVGSLGRRLVDDRGDVPGWVLVTVMTAGLVTGLWVIADEQLSSLLNRAISSVSK